MNTYLPTLFKRESNILIKGGSINQSFKVAIPTYGRPKQLLEKTLKYLNECKIQHKNIYTFVDNKEQQTLYKKYLPPSYQVIRGGDTGKLGHDGINNFIVDYFKKDTPVLFIHDDVSGIFKSICNPKPHQKKITTDLNKTLEFLLNEMDKSKTILGGFSVGSNNMWNCAIKEDIRTDILNIPSRCYLMRIDKDIKLDKGSIVDDVERSFKVRDKYGSVVFLSKYFTIANQKTMEGGLDKSNVDLKVKNDLLRLQKKFPHYIKEVVADNSKNPQNYKWKPKYQKVEGGSLDDDYVIAIPSYKRIDILKDKTLTTLESYNIPQNKIYIFLANKEEYEKYKTEIGGKYNYVLGVLKLYKQRNFISKYFPVGKRLVQIDDDVSRITKLGNKKLIDLSNLDKFIKEAFKETKKLRCKLWGIYPVDNHFFMKNTITTDLRYIVGAFFGIINRHDKDLILDLEDKEDYLRTIQYFKKDGGVVRFNYIGIKTKYFGEGGMNINPKERFNEGKKNVMILKKRFPNLVNIVEPKEASPYWDIRLKRIPSEL